MVSPTGSVATAPPPPATLAAHSSATDPHKICAVCGIKASGLHFGVFTCESCKLFYLRVTKTNAQESLTCSGSSGAAAAASGASSGTPSGSCVINERTRAFCRYCRFNKCLAVGMARQNSRLGRNARQDGAARKNHLHKLSSQKPPDSTSGVGCIVGESSVCSALPPPPPPPRKTSASCISQTSAPKSPRRKRSLQQPLYVDTCSSSSSSSSDLSASIRPHSISTLAELGDPTVCHSSGTPSSQTATSSSSSDSGSRTPDEGPSALFRGILSSVACSNQQEEEEQSAPPKCRFPVPPMPPPPLSLPVSIKTESSHTPYPEMLPHNISPEALFCPSDSPLGPSGTLDHRNSFNDDCRLKSSPERTTTGLQRYPQCRFPVPAFPPPPAPSCSVTPVFTSQFSSSISVSQIAGPASSELQACLDYQGLAHRERLVDTNPAALSTTLSMDTSGDPLEDLLSILPPDPSLGGMECPCPVKSGESDVCIEENELAPFVLSESRLSMDMLSRFLNQQEMLRLSCWVDLYDSFVVEIEPVLVTNFRMLPFSEAVSRNAALCTEWFDRTFFSRNPTFSAFHFRPPEDSLPPPPPPLSNLNYANVILFAGIIPCGISFYHVYLDAIIRGKSQLGPKKEIHLFNRRTFRKWKELRMTKFEIVLALNLFTFQILLTTFPEQRCTQMDVEQSYLVSIVHKVLSSTCRDFISSELEFVHNYLQAQLDKWRVASPRGAGISVLDM